MSFLNDRDNFQTDSRFYKRKRQQSDSTDCDKVDDYFNKRHDFYFENKWIFSASSSIFTEKTWKISHFQLMKDELNEVKGQLSQFNLEEWSRHTKARDPAGYVFRDLKKYVKPELLTQAWCKFYECICQFPVISDLVMLRKKLNSLHLCEAPGAFVSALNHFIASNYKDVEWSWIANSLNPEYEGNDLQHMIPDKRLINQTRPNWCFGLDSTGDITKFYNYETIVAEAKKLGEILLVTADGSVNCMSNPGEQESLVEHLHFCEVVTALSVLSPDGSFVVKMFTVFESSTICLLYLLISTFSSVHAFKPCTSKSGNSEVYIICLRYKGKDQFLRHLPQFLQVYKNYDPNFSMFPRSSIPDSFLAQIQKCSIFFMNKQINTITDNIYCFQKILRYEYRKNDDLKNWVAKHFLAKYRVKPIDQFCKLATREINLYFANRSTIFESDNLISNISCADFYEGCENINLHFEIGEQISRTLYSEFCEFTLLQKLNEVQDFSEAHLNLSLTCHLNTEKNPEASLDSQFTNLLTEQKIAGKFDHILHVAYLTNNNEYIQKLFYSIFEAVKILKPDKDLVLIGPLFLTRFEASILLLLVLTFTSVQYYSGVIILKNTTTKLNKTVTLFNQVSKRMKHFDKSLSTHFTPFLLNILPDKTLRNQNFVNFLRNYNNKTIELYTKPSKE